MPSKFGIHIPNSRSRQFDRLLNMGVHNYTGLHLNAPLLRAVRGRHPEARILVRFYLDNWSTADPRQWARDCARWVRENPGITQHYTPANEMNLSHEGGGDTPEWYERINLWLLEWREEFLSLVPDTTLHWPALAFGHYEDEYGYETCGKSLDAYNIVDYHPYWRLGELWGDEAEWYAFRFVRDREKFFPNKEVFISECGNQAHQDPRTAAEMLYFFNELYKYDWVLGATPFIWDSGTEHEQSIWVGNECLIETVTHAYKPDVETPGRPRYVDLVGELPTRGSYTSRSLNAVTLAVLHHSVTWLDDQRELIERIARYHVETRGWPGIAYHYCASPDGTVWRTNPAWKASYHAGDVNGYSVGICFLGDYRYRVPTPVQIQAAKNLLRGLKRVCPNLETVVGHREVRPTLCPGDNIMAIKEELWAEIR